MSRHKASMDWFAGDGSAGIRIPCTVDFHQRSIKVSYDLDGQACSYSGGDKTGHGHYVLTPDHCHGTATLFGVLPADVPGSLDALPLKLEGSYVEDGWTGMWRVSIHADPA